MNRFLKIGKVIVFALFAVQYVYAIWWGIQNIGVVPDFSISSESFLYHQLTLIIGKGFWVIYLLQAIVLYYGISIFMPKNQWVARFAITNPLLLQFTFSLTPDVFSLSVTLILLGSLIKKEEVKSKHAFLLVFLGLMSSRYFLLGVLIVVIMIFQVWRMNQRGETEEKTKKEIVSYRIAIVQMIFVIVLIVLAQRILFNNGDYSSVQEGYVERFTVDENIPGNHSTASITKGLVENSLMYILEPVSNLYVIDELQLTQNNWNYINFTKEVPEWSRNYMEVTARNMMIVALFYIVIGSTCLLILPNRRKAFQNQKLYAITLLGICVIFAITSRRGMDYRLGLIMIPVWYGAILSLFEDVRVFENKEKK